MRTVVIAVIAVGAIAVGALVGALAASGGSSESSASEQEIQRNADLWAIDQIEKNFHKATSRKDVDLMMSLWAPNATLTVGPGQTAAGKNEIRRFWLTKAAVFKPENKWLSDTPAYKIRHHGQRRQGHALVRVPLHRSEDQTGPVDYARRPGGRPDRRRMADHEHGRRNGSP